MKIILINTGPGEVILTNITYNQQNVGLARALTKLGHQCDIMCCTEKGERVEKIELENGKNIVVYYVNAKIILKNGIMKFDHDILKKYDIIQAVEYNLFYTWRLSKEFKGKYVIYHGPYYNKFNKRYNLMAKFFDLFFLKRYLKYNTPFITKRNKKCTKHRSWYRFRCFKC